MKLNILGKLLLAFAIVLAFMLVVGTVGIYEAAVLTDRSSLMYDIDLVSSGYIAELARLAMQDRVVELEHVLAVDPTDKAGAQAEINSLDQKVDQTLQALQASDSAGQLASKIQAFQLAWTDYKQARDTLT